MSKIMPAMLASVWMLTGCVSGATLMPAASTRRPPPNLITPCEDLPPLRSARGADLLDNHVQTAELYYDCKARHKALSDWANDENLDRHR